VAVVKPMARVQKSLLSIVALQPGADGVALAHVEHVALTVRARQQRTREHQRLADPVGLVDDAQAISNEGSLPTNEGSPHRIEGSSLIPLLIVSMALLAKQRPKINKKTFSNQQHSALHCCQWAALLWFLLIKFGLAIDHPAPIWASGAHPRFE
jgi:hypothetical protein